MRGAWTSSCGWWAEGEDLQSRQGDSRMSKWRELRWENEARMVAVVQQRKRRASWVPARPNLHSLSGGRVWPCCLKHPSSGAPAGVSPTPARMQA